MRTENPQPGLPEVTPRAASFALLGLLLFALAVRLYRMDEPPRDFWTVRQYNAPLMARAFYYLDEPHRPAWELDLARAHLQHCFQGEPPVMERLAAQVFRLIGREAFWPLRALPIACWIVAGVLLYRLARRGLGEPGSLAAAGVFLLLPYGVVVSRSLQPESLMIIGLLAAALSIVRYDEKPTACRWWLAALLAGLAILVKPGVSAFAVSGCYFLTLLHRRGWSGALRTPSLYGFMLMAALPTALFLVARAQGAELGEAVLQREFSMDLLTRRYFWQGWLTQLVTVHGLPLLLVGAWGLLWFFRQPLLGGLVGWAIGYAAVSLLRTMGTPSHDYLHVQAIPLVALGAGAFLEAAVRAAPGRAAWKYTSAALVGLAGVVLSYARDPLIRAPPSIRDFEEMAAAIGRHVGHSTRTIMLDYDGGMALRYFAKIDGWSWPVSASTAFHNAIGFPRAKESHELTARQRFEEYYAQLDPHYFVVTRATPEFGLQRGLHDFLYAHRLVAIGERYVIFDLRAPRDQEAPRE